MSVKVLLCNLSNVFRYLQQTLADIVFFKALVLDEGPVNHEGLCDVIIMSVTGVVYCKYKLLSFSQVTTNTSAQKSHHFFFFFTRGLLGKQQIHCKCYKVIRQECELAFTWLAESAFYWMTQHCGKGSALIHFFARRLSVVFLLTLVLTPYCSDSKGLTIIWVCL